MVFSEEEKKRLEIENNWFMQAWKHAEILGNYGVLTETALDLLDMPIKDEYKQAAIELLIYSTRNALNVIKNQSQMENTILSQIKRIKELEEKVKEFCDGGLNRILLLECRINELETRLKSIRDQTDIIKE